MTFLAEWFQPEELLLKPQIQSMLDNVTEEVKKSLKVVNPSHSLFSIPAEILEKWKVERLSDNQFSDEESMQIIDCLRNDMSRLGFRKATSETVKDRHPSKSHYLNEVCV